MIAIFRNLPWTMKSLKIRFHVFAFYLHICFLLHTAFIFKNDFGRHIYVFCFFLKYMFLFAIRLGTAVPIAVLHKVFVPALTFRIQLNIV